MQTNYTKNVSVYFERQEIKLHYSLYLWNVFITVKNWYKDISPLCQFEWKKKNKAEVHIRQLFVQGSQTYFYGRQLACPQLPIVTQ
jgi:hypothetical protein